MADDTPLDLDLIRRVLAEPVHPDTIIVGPRGLRELATSTAALPSGTDWFRVAAQCPENCVIVLSRGSFTYVEVL